MFVSFPVGLICCWGWIAGGSRWRRVGLWWPGEGLVERGVLVVKCKIIIIIIIIINENITINHM
jgi:hypothetical protein